MRKIAVMFFIALLCSTIGAFAQEPIKGVVMDATTGSPLAGASVKVRGTNTGTSAEADGSFSINATTKVTLEVTMVGFAGKMVEASPGETLSILLDPASKTGTEVVVTALGIARSRNTLPYAAQKVQGADVSQTRGTNFASNLSGKVSGLEIRQNNTMGGSTNVVMRGFKSLKGSNQALFVIDGVPIDNSNTNNANQTTGRGGYDYGNAAADINPDDIESISVLKGAAASALYGSRGFNGVILITTKKGRKGFNVTINSGVIHSSILRNTFPTYQKQYGQGYGPTYGNDTNGDGRPDEFFNKSDLNNDGIPDLITPITEDASYGAPFDPNLMVYQWQSFDPTSPNFGKPLPWVAAANDPSTFFERPLSYNNSVFIEAGNEKGTLALGYTRSNERGILPNSQLNKDLVNFSSSYKITDKVTAAASVNYSSISGLGRYGTGYSGDQGLNLMTNFRQWWNVGVDVKELKDAYLRSDRRNVTWNPAKINNIFRPIYWDNPYFTRYENFESDNRRRLFGNTSINYKPVDWLNILGRVAIDTYDEMQEERIAVGSKGVSSYGRTNRRYNEINYDLLANADRDISNDLNLKGLLGTNIRVQKSSNVDATTNGGLVVPGLYALSNSANTLLPPVEFEGTRRIEGIFAGATLTYKSTYILDATVRRDRSSTLPSNNNVFYYPSISAGFVFSELYKPDWLNYGKLRANYAEVGGDAPLFSINSAYVHDIDANSGNEVSSFDGNALYSVPGTKNNPNLRPERTKSFEAGLEASFLKSRLGFDITYYDARTVDQIIPVAVSTATGYTQKFVNSGQIRNNGIEVSLSATPVKTTHFSWDVNVNWTRNRNKVLVLFSGVDNIVLGDFQGGITLNASLNQPYGTIHGTDFVYLNGQKRVGPDGKYLITESNNITIGNINPDWIGGVNNKFSYKDLFASFLIDVRQGGDVFSTDMYYGLATGLYPETAGLNDLGNPLRSPISEGGGIIREGVEAEGKPNKIRDEATDYGVFGYRFSPNKPFVYDASFVKLREATIGYSLPKKLFKKGAIKGVDFSLVGRNLWIIHKNLPYSDPEEGFSSGNLQGIQTGAYPAVRTVGFNVKVRL